ncbi:MAG TPA: hypothetical protein VE955_07330 [Candidatus Dormibacteraeota bacterium]|nr:hypothetical protein [Candidatus Dormibacteraeota bacterium]
MSKSSPVRGDKMADHWSSFGSPQSKLASSFFLSLDATLTLL